MVHVQKYAYLVVRKRVSLCHVCGDERSAFLLGVRSNMRPTSRGGADLRNAEFISKNWASERHKVVHPVKLLCMMFLTL